MFIKAFEKMPPEAMEIRKEVFVDEQGFHDEFDDIDKTAIHFILYDEEKNALGVCRAFCDNDRGEYHIGRVAVKKQFRGRNYGADIVRSAEKYIKAHHGKSVELSAQVRASAFYEKLGYEKYGDIFYDEYCPHIMMKKEL